MAAVRCRGCDPNGLGENGWEELPYWLKGYGDLGYVLHDSVIIKNARRWIDAVLASQQADGYFGPRANKTGLDGQPDLWPHMVMCNVLQSFYEATADERVLPFLTRYFHWLNTQPADVERCIEVYRDVEGGAYAHVERYERGQSIQLLAFSDVSIAVSDVLK